MLAFDDQSAEEYSAWSHQLPKPKALLFFSAHWETATPEFGEAARHDELIYDFYGFPDKLQQLQYPAPGAPWLIPLVEQQLQETLPKNVRGLDHGVWIPLLHMWPQADVPVLQISLPASYSNAMLFELGRRLSPLRNQGIMIAGGGTLSHNLREGLSRQHHDTPEWVTRFDQWLEDSLLNNRTQLLNWENAPEARRNHPTPEHFRPLLITLGAASENEQAHFPMTGFDMAVFSKRSVQFG